MHKDKWSVLGITSTNAFAPPQYVHRYTKVFSTYVGAYYWVEKISFDYQISYLNHILSHDQKFQIFQDFWSQLI